MYPTFVGKNNDQNNKNNQALHEIHIFLEPLNPDEVVLQRYYTAVEEWNKLNINNTYTMKACYLCLVFNIDGKEVDVNVMQSARYYRTNYTDNIIQECHNDAKYFSDFGFSILREKIEANVHSIIGIPQTVTDVATYPDNYFEFHIKVQRKDKKVGNTQITTQEVEQLKMVSKKLTHIYRRPVPLSYNKNKDKMNQDNEGHQRFLNVRFRNKGFTDIKHDLDNIKNLIVEHTDFEVIKSIDEYVWFDTNPSLDQGWIDFEPARETCILREIDTLFLKNSQTE